MRFQYCFIVLFISACSEPPPAVSQQAPTNPTPHELDSFRPAEKPPARTAPPQLYDNVGPKPGIMPESDFFADKIREQEMLHSDKTATPLTPPDTNATAVGKLSPLNIVLPKIATPSAPPPAATANQFNREEMMTLASDSGCLQCHGLNSSHMGPTFHQIAARYRQEGNAQAQLVKSISQGSSGKWDLVLMPANSPRVSDSDISRLSEFILSLR